MEFMYHDRVCERHWASLFTEFAEFQLVLCDVHGAAVAAGFTIPVAWAISSRPGSGGMLNLDTHVLLHALGGELTRREAVLLGRIDMDLDDVELARTLHRIHVWPPTLDVCRAMRQLDFRGDPADELIAATSLVHRVPLVTRDRRILRSRRVPLAREARAAAARYSAGNVTTCSTYASGRTRVPVANAAEEGWEEWTRWPEGRPRL